MEEKLYWNGKNAIQLTQDIAVKPGEALPVGDDGKITVDKETLAEFKKNGLVSEYSSLAAKTEAEKPDLEKENTELKKEIESLKKDGDKKLLKENEELKKENESLKKEIALLNSPIE